MQGRSCADARFRNSGGETCIRELIPCTSASTRLAVDAPTCLKVRVSFEEALEFLLLRRFTIRTPQPCAFVFPALFFGCTTRCNALRSVSACADSRRLQGICCEQANAPAPAANVCVCVVPVKLAARVYLASLRNHHLTLLFLRTATRIQPDGFCIAFDRSGILRTCAG